jgi:hypothetical protein
MLPVQRGGGSVGAMSGPVDLSRLREEVSNFGPAPYLITVTADGRPHTVAVGVDWDDRLLYAGAGSTTMVNVSERPAVSLVWPPITPGGYSLIVDGRASADQERERVLIEPIKAVLHRRRAEGRGSDCVSVLSASSPRPDSTTASPC